MGFTLALALAEIILRAFWPQPTGPVQFSFDPVRGSIPTPNQRGRRTIPGVLDYTFSNSSLGLRGKEIGPKTGPRILLLGDSFTYGFGVNDDQTFAYQLQQLTGYEVINAGNGGTGTDYALRFFETVGKDFNSDLVVLCFFANDFQDNERGTYYDENLNPRDLSQTPMARKNFLNNRFCNWVLTHSHVANLLKTELIHTGLWQISGPIDESHINSALAKRYLDLLAAKVHEASARFLVVYIPNDHDVTAFRKGEGSKSEQALGSIHSMISLTPALSKSGAGINQLYFPGEGHWTAVAHQEAAKALVPIVTSELRR